MVVENLDSADEVAIESCLIRDGPDDIPGGDLVGEAHFQPEGFHFGIAPPMSFLASFFPGGAIWRPSV